MNYYSMRFDVSPHIFNQIKVIMGDNTSRNDSSISFEYSKIKANNYWKCLSQIVESLEVRLNEINSLGVESDQISLWFLTPHSDQKNLEFSPDLLKKIGDVGIVFCVSIY